MALVSSGSMEDNLRIAEEHGLANVLLQEGSEVLDAYRVRATPAAVMVTPDGKDRERRGEGPHAIEPLIRLTLQGRNAGSDRGGMARDPSSSSVRASEQPRPRARGPARRSRGALATGQL